MGNLLDSASIVLTPTAYDNGKMLSVKPIPVYGPELVDSWTNKDFSAFTSSGSTITQMVSSGSGNNCYSLVTFESGKTYKLEFTSSQNITAQIRISNNDSLTGAQVVFSNPVSGLNSVTFTANANYSYIGFYAPVSFTDTQINGFFAKEVFVEDGDFDFSRNSAATRVNAQGLVENVQILSGDLVSNGDFSQIGTEEISNGSFSQIGPEEVSNGSFSQTGAEEVTNGDFATDTDWSFIGDTIIQNGVAEFPTSTNSFLIQSNVIPLSVKTYKLQYEVITTNGDNFRLAGGASAFGTVALDSATIGVKTVYIVSNGINRNLQFNNDSFIGSIDNVSVKEVGQDWTLQDGWSIGEDKAVSDGTVNKGVIQENIFTIGKTYKITFDVDVTSGTLSSRIRFKNDFSATTIANISSSGSYTFYQEADRTGLQYIMLSDNAATSSITNISVQEVGQDWTLGGEVTIGDNLAHFESNTNTYSYIRQDISSLTSKTYKIQLEVKNYVSGAVQVVFQGASPIVQDLNVSSDGVYTAYLTPNANGDDFEVSRRFDGGNFNFDITNISVKEVGQDWNEKSGVIVSVDSSGLVFDNSTGNDAAGVFQNIGLSDGKKYRMTATMQLLTGASNGTLLLQTSTASGSGQSLVYTGETLVVGGDAVTETFEFTPALGDVSVQLACNEANATFKISNISVIEITDDTNLPRINYEGFSYQDVLGPELVTNGDFATDTNWVKGAGWIISGGSANANNATSDLYQENVVESGKYYKVTYTISNYVSGSVRVEIPSNAYDGALRTANGTYTEILLSGGTIILFDGRTSFNGSIDNVSVKEVLGQEVVPDSGCGSWLLEPQSTNLVPYSEDLESFPIKSGISVISNAAISPDGLQNASKLIPATSNNANHYIRTDISVVNGSEYVMSFFAKKGEYNYVNTYTSAYSTGVTATWDLNAGVVALGSPNADIEDYGNGWYRCIWKGTTNTTSLSYRIYVSEFEDRNTSFAGDGVKGAYVYGAMLEKQSYATSYIPTNGATTTRLQDIANNSGNASLINSTEGVLYAETAALALTSSLEMLSLNDGTYNNVVLFRYYDTSSNDIQVQVKVGGSLQASILFTLSDAKAFNKIALKYKENDFALWVNGAKVGTDTSGTTFPADTLNKLSFNRGDGSNPLFGKTKALVVYKEALTDEQLTCLTTI